MSLDTGSRTVLAVSQGAFVYTHNSCSLFDANGIIQSKIFLNGLKPVKINGKNVKEACGVVSLKKDIAGFILFYNNSTVNKLQMTDFKILNTWHEFTDDKTLITCATPYYSEDDMIVCVSENYKIKQMSVADIQGKRNISSGDCIKACYCIEKNCKDAVLFTGSNGDYCVLPPEEIPVLGRNASGVKTSFEQETQLYITTLSPEKEIVLFSSNDDRDGQNYIEARSTDQFAVGKRSNKLKLLGYPEHFKITSVSNISAQNKDGTIVLIGRNSTTTLKPQYFKFFKKNNDFKRTFVSIVGSINLM
jgi:hypothetical protein